jgi:hypothetical protein
LGPLKSGIPDSVEIPAPVKTRIIPAPRSASIAAAICFMAVIGAIIHPGGP